MPICAGVNTKTLRVQNFTVYQRSCDKLADGARAAYYSVTVHHFKLPSVVFECRLKGASRHVTNICGQSIRPSLHTETRVVMLSNPKPGLSLGLKGLYLLRLLTRYLVTSSSMMWSLMLAYLRLLSFCKLKKKNCVRGWRDGPAVKSTGGSSRGSGFNSQHLCDSS